MQAFLPQRSRPPRRCTHGPAHFPLCPWLSSYRWAKLEEARPGFTSAAVPQHLFRHRQERSRTPYNLNLTPRLTVTHSACIRDAYAGSSFTSCTFEGKIKESSAEQVNREWNEWKYSLKKERAFRACENWCDVMFNVEWKKQIQMAVHHENIALFRS